jgi:hypothetical protein
MLGIVVHACNLIYKEGGGRRIKAMGKSLRLYLKKIN